MGELIKLGLERKEFADRILNYRFKKDLSQEEFGDMAHATVSTVYNWEKGRTLPCNRAQLKRLRRIGII